MCTVFISYSRKDMDIANQLAQDLQKAGLDTWWDISGLKGGDAWVRTIQAALKASKCCVVVLSPDGVESEWVEKEYTYAIGLGLRIIPILYKNCEVPLALSNIQYIDFRGKRYERGLQELFEILEVLAPDEEEARLGLIEGPHPPVKRTLAKPRLPVNWERVGAIAGVIGVLIALAAWLVPRAADLLFAQRSKTLMIPTLPLSTPVPTSTLFILPTPTMTPVVPPTPTMTPIVSPTLLDMVYVPAGDFIMGSSDAEVDSALALCNEYSSNCKRDWFEDEQPQHMVYLDTFYIDKTEVTNTQYRVCVETGTCDAPSDTTYYDNADYAQHPVVYVNWHQAKAYCEWAGQRLPTEAEWEKAARGTDGRTYPWGAGIDCDRAQVGVLCGGETVPVGSKPKGASPYGALDMAGNAWEWVADWYDSGYYSQSPRRNPLGPDSGGYRVARGGRVNKPIYVRGAHRFGVPPQDSDNLGGFRCAKSSP